MLRNRRKESSQKTILIINKRTETHAVSVLFIRERVMRIQELLIEVDKRKPNSLTTEEKLKYLSRFDMMAVNDIFAHFENGTEEISPYTESDLNKELLIPAPWDEAYIYYMHSVIDRDNEETDLYNNDIALLNAVMDNLRTSWIRDHMPKQMASINPFGGKRR